MSDPIRPADEELRELLVRLREVLSKTEIADQKSRDLLHELTERTAKLLEEPSVGLGDARSHLHEGLLGAVERFEGTHPELAALIGKVADLLSGLGI